MRLVGPLLGRLRIGRMRDWCRFTYARVRTPGTIRAAGLPHIDPPFRLEMSPGATLVLGRNVRFGAGFSASIAGDGVVEIGDDTAFNVSCWVGVTSRLTVGSGCLFGPFVTIVDGNHRFDDPGQRIWDQGLETREITIGDNVWVGGKASLINCVGHDAVVGANAVVARPLPDRAVAVGVPARIIRIRGASEQADHA